MNKDFLQKYVDKKLSVMYPDMDNLSDYITNYCNGEGFVDENFLNKKIDLKDFIENFNPTKKQLKEAIKKSPILKKLADKYIKAVIETIPNDIIDNLIPDEKSNIKWSIKCDLQDKEFNENKESAIAKIKIAKLTKKEEAALKQFWIYERP